jgi:hypothetical protein
MPRYGVGTETERPNRPLPYGTIDIASLLGRGAEVPVGGAGGGGGGVELASILASIAARGDAAKDAIRKLFEETEAGARSEERRIVEEVAPRRREQAQETYDTAGARVAEMEARVAESAAGQGVYVAPGGTLDAQTYLASGGARAVEFADTLSNISADDARFFAMSAAAEGASYIGAITTLIAQMSMQAEMEHANRNAALAGAIGEGAVTGSPYDQLDSEIDRAFEMGLGPEDVLLRLQVGPMSPMEQRALVQYIRNRMVTRDRRIAERAGAASANLPAPSSAFE